MAWGRLRLRERKYHHSNSFAKLQGMSEARYCLRFQPIRIRFFGVIEGGIAPQST